MIQLKTLDDYKRLVGQFKGLESTENYRLIRHLLRTDLFFLLWFGFGRKDIEHPWLLSRCKEVQNSPDGFLDLWARESYKDIANSVPIITVNRGWITHGEIQIGDRVFSPNGKPVKVLALSPQYTDSECFEITFSDNAKITCGAGHLWRLRRKIRRRIANSQLRYIEFAEEIYSTIELVNKSGRLDVGVSKPLYYMPAFLPIHPYILGAWLGDGHSSCGRLTSGDPEIFEKIASLGFTLSENKTITKNIYGLMPKLRKLGVLNNKHIPEIYLSSSFDQRMELLRGLMDTDGHCTTKGHAVFISKSEILANQVRDLSNSLGLRARLKKYSFKFNFKKTGQGIYEYYQVAFPCHEDKNIFTLRRKANRARCLYGHRNTRCIKTIKKIESVPTKCIQVEGGMYVVGRDLIPTHNSTIITFAHTVLDILASHGDNPLPAWNGLEPSFGLFSHTRPIAKGFLRQIKREFESNELLRSYFPDIIWDNCSKEAPKWSEDDGLILKRKSNPKESTIEAWGLVESQPTGKHFDVMIYDDVVTLASITTPEMMRKTIEAWEMSINLGSGNVKRRHIGTRYHFNDAYREIMKRKAAIPRIYPATEDGTPEGKPVLKTKEKIAELRKMLGPYTFSTQQLLNPVADEAQGFKREWLKYHKGSDGSGTNRYLIIDPASEKKKTSDFTSAWVIGLGGDENYHVLDLVRDRLNLVERGDMLFRLHKKWKPLGVGYEKYGMQADIEYYKDKMARENYYFEIIELGGAMAKNDRIRRLIPSMSSGRWYFPDALFRTDYQGIYHDLIDAYINEEYLAFPVPIHDDMLDCQSRIIDPELNALWPRLEHDDEHDRYSQSKRKRSHSSWAS